MARRAVAFVRAIDWLFTPPLPAIEIGGALSALGWIAALLIDPDFIELPSFRVIAIAPPGVLTAVMTLLIALAVAALSRPLAVTISRLVSGFVALALAMTFLATQAWAIAVTFGVLGLGLLAAAIHSEAARP